jgi:hypothetical protein
MKIRGFMVVVFFATLAFAPAKLNAQNGYVARLVSPTAGQVLYPGQKVRVEWTATLPKVNYLDGCEMEVWLSLDGGHSFLSCITPILDPKARFFYWTVPNTPTNAAVLDIRFGCDGYYPESYAPQTASIFAIAQTAGQLY